MSSRLIDQSSSELSQVNGQQVNDKTASKSHALNVCNTKKCRNKNQAFALSSTAFSVCLALSSYSLPSLITPAFADGPKGGVIIGGSGDISKIDTATTLVNQSSHHMAINWDSYNRNKSGSE